MRSSGEDVDGFCNYHRPTNFSVKRRMRPARFACADRESLSAFILCFAGMKAFLFLPFVLVLVLARIQRIEDEDENDVKGKMVSSRSGLQSIIRRVIVFARLFERSEYGKTLVHI